MKKSATVLLALAFVLLSVAGTWITGIDASAESVQEATQDEYPFHVVFEPQGSNDLSMKIRFTEQGREMVTQSPSRLELVPENGLVIQAGKTNIDLAKEPDLSSSGISVTLSYDRSEGTQRTDTGDIVPKLTMTLYSSSSPVCVYQAEFDVTPVARAVLIAQDYQGVDNAEGAVERMERLWDQTYCSGRQTDITRWDLNAPLRSVRDMFSNFRQKPDRNDLTYIYISAHGTQQGFLLWGARDDSIGDLPIIYYSTFFEQLSKYDGRYVVVIDACMSGSAVDTAEEMPDSSGMQNLDEDRFFVLTSMDRTTISTFGILATRIEVFSTLPRFFDTTITCGELYGYLRNGDSETLKGVFGEAEEPGSALQEGLWGVAKFLSQDSQAYGNGSLPFFIHDQENSDLDDVPLAFLRDTYTMVPATTIDSLVIGRGGWFDGEIYHHNITVFCVDENGNLILDISGRPVKCDVSTDNDLVEDPRYFHMRVWLVEHRYVVLEVIDPSVYPNAKDKHAVVYRVLGLDKEGRLTDLLSARTNSRGGDVYCYSGDDFVKTLGSLEVDAEALRGFFLPYCVDFNEMAQVLVPYPSDSESETISYRRTFITDEVQWKFVYDTDQRGYYKLPDTQSIIDERYQPMEVRLKPEVTASAEQEPGSIEPVEDLNYEPPDTQSIIDEIHQPWESRWEPEATVPAEQEPDSIEPADQFLMELKGLLPDLTLTSTTRELDQGIWTEEYKTGNGCVLTITADAATGAIRKLRFSDSSLYGFGKGRISVFDPGVFRSTGSMQYVVDMVAASEAFDLAQSVRDAIYDKDFAALYTAVKDEIGNETLKGTEKYDGVTIEIYKRRQVAGMESVSSYIVFTFE